jgi:hypothetical protein
LGVVASVAGTFMGILGWVPSVDDTVMRILGISG